MLIFQSLDITELTTDAGAYGMNSRGRISLLLTFFPGSYVGAGRLISTIQTNDSVSDYARWLDLDDGIVRARWTQSDITFIRYVKISSITCP